jgi:hypothetical protein
MLTFIIVVSIGTFSNASGSTADKISTTQSLAFTAIRSAEVEGKDVSHMLADYNTAIVLLEQNSPNFDGNCSSPTSCAQVSRAEQMLQSIISNSSPDKSSSYANVLTTVITILECAVGAIAGSLAIFAIWNTWRNAILKQFLGAQIRRKSND